MSIVSLIGFGICAILALSLLKRGSDPLSPARLFAFIWFMAIALMDLKFSHLQHDWNLESWFLLSIGVGGFLVGAFVGYVLHLDVKLLPISTVRQVLREEKINGDLLFRLIVFSVIVYAISYAVIYIVKGFLPIFVVGTRVSRVDFAVFGFGVLINSPAFIIFFTVLYLLYARGERLKKGVLITLAIFTLGSYTLLLQRFEIMMAAVLSCALLYYASNVIRVRTAIIGFALVAAFFFGIMSIRLGELVASYYYYLSKMTFPREYAQLTEPYMYVVMNLENFARAATLSDYHTFGYFSLDFVAALTGLKYWVLEYFNITRMPHLDSSYNTYTALFWFYSDFGVFGLAGIPWILGLASSTLYYRMRRSPSLKRVTAYGVLLFVDIISFFNFPIAFLWFQFNLLVLYLFLRWTTQRKSISSQRVAVAGSDAGWGMT
jgi:oligosaccharide repeat unit polymerase